MNHKYEIKTFPEYFQLEDSEEEKLKSKFKHSTNVNPEIISDDFSQPECIFTKENKNISFYESDSRDNSYKERRFKSLNKKISRPNYDSDVIYKKSSSPPMNFVEEQFSYNYINTEENNKNKNKSNIISPDQRICLNEYMQQKSNHFPRRTIKTYQDQFDVEKSDNFNVLSYRPEDYESNYIKTDAKSKIIQIFKKEEVDELFYPSNRKPSPLSPLSNTNSDKKEKLLSYQTPTLKFQSFFGSYTRPKHAKTNMQAKSTSKIKKNQLEDFNIDKLIEIGDNCSNKWKNILSFGKKINNMKNKSKLHYNSENELKINKILKLKKNEIHKQKGNLIGMMHVSPKKRDNEEIIKNFNDNQNKKLMANKIVYHGHIKRKKNIKINTKTINDQIKDINNRNKFNEDINKNINIDNEKKQIIINNNPNIIINNQNKFKKIVHSNGKEFFYKENKKNPICHQIIPKKNLHRKMIDINLNGKFYSINNYPNENNIIEKNNYTMMIKDNNDNQNKSSKKVLLTEEGNNLNTKNIIQQIKPTIRKASLKEVNQEGNEKKYNKNNKTNLNNTNFTTNKSSKKFNEKGFKSKNYYGYDERHNLEGIINNHSYYVSAYSRKKVNKKKDSIDKIN